MREGETPVPGWVYAISPWGEPGRGWFCGLALGGTSYFRLPFGEVRGEEVKHYRWCIPRWVKDGLLVPGPGWEEDDDGPFLTDGIEPNGDTELKWWLTRMNLHWMPSKAYMVPCTERYHGPPPRPTTPRGLVWDPDYVVRAR